MPLDHVNGEHIDGMDLYYRIVPVRKYQEQTRLTTLVEETTGRTFKRKIVVEKPIFAAAWEHAARAFAAAGVSAGARQIDILAQEYPRTGQVCFIFCTHHLGQDYYIKVPFQLTAEQISDLAMRDLWKIEEGTVH